MGGRLEPLAGFDLGEEGRGQDGAAEGAQVREGLVVGSCSEGEMLDREVNNNINNNKNGGGVFLRCFIAYFQVVTRYYHCVGVVARVREEGPRQVQRGEELIVDEGGKRLPRDVFHRVGEELKPHVGVDWGSVGVRDGRFGEDAGHGFCSGAWTEPYRAASHWLGYRGETRENRLIRARGDCGKVSEGIWKRIVSKKGIPNIQGRQVGNCCKTYNLVQYRSAGWPKHPR